MSILCGVDFSPRSLEAVTAAAAIAGRARQALWLVSVIEPAAVKDLGPNSREHFEQGVLQRLEAEATRVKALAPVTHVAVYFGAPAAELKRAAEEKQASLLVVASAGHAHEPLIRLGGTSEKAAVGTAPPVLVVREAAPFEAWAAQRRPLKVVVGADDGSATDAAVHWANALRAFGPVDLVIGHVYYADEAHLRYGLERPASYLERHPELEALIERDLQRRFPPLPGSGETFHRARLGLGRIADHLLELAREWQADLVVVGTHGKRGLMRLGSVSSGALHHAGTAVAMVPVSAQPHPEARPSPLVARVLVGTDFSELGDAALPWAFALTPPDGEVLLTHVVKTDASAVTPVELYLQGTTVADQPPERVALEVAQRLQNLARRAPAAAHRASRVVSTSGPDVARALCEAAAREAADLIVLGSHGRSGLSRAVLGSVAEAVTRQSRCPVVIIPARRP
jgi:nucleotide-binding universal stress UspA family protein